MKAKRWLILSALSLVFGLGGYVIGIFQSVGIEVARQISAIEKIPESTAPKNLSEIIADQIKSGDASCPQSDLLTFEACLLFQGALGTWQRFGLADSCPDILDPKKTPPTMLEGEKFEITREDVLRAKKAPCFGYLYAINVANATPILVDTANRTFQMAVVPHFSEPGSDPELCLAARHGICGNHAAVAVGFFERAGFQARPVEFYYEHEGARLSHITPEVWIDGHWRLIDATYGAYWIDQRPGSKFELLPTDRVLAGESKDIFFNAALLPYGFQSAVARVNYFSYLTEKADVIRGGSGEIGLRLRDRAGIENFHHKPNFIGDNKPDGQSAGLKFRLASEKGEYHLTVTATAAAFSDVAPAFICIDDSCEEYSEGRDEYDFFVKNPSGLYLKTNTDVAYIVMKSLNWKVVSGPDS